MNAIQAFVPEHVRHVRRNGHEIDPCAGEPAHTGGNPRRERIGVDRPIDAERHGPREYDHLRIIGLMLGAVLPLAFLDHHLQKRRRGLDSHAGEQTNGGTSETLVTHVVDLSRANRTEETDSRDSGMRECTRTVTTCGQPGIVLHFSDRWEGAWHAREFRQSFRWSSRRKCGKAWACGWDKSYRSSRKAE